MSGTIVNLFFCADYESQFDVLSTRGDVSYVVTWSGTHAHCACPAYEYSKHEPKHCKHIDRTFKEGCFYNEQWYDGGTQKLRPSRVTTKTVSGESCPKCGGPVILMRCLV